MGCKGSNPHLQTNLKTKKHTLYKMAKTKVEGKEEIKDEDSKTILDIIQENIEKYSKYFNKNTKSGEEPEPEMYPLIIFDTYEDFVKYKKYDKTGASGVGMELNMLHTNV